MNSGICLAKLLSGVAGGAVILAGAWSSAALANENETSASVDDIVVTAQFRQESAQKAAVSLDVLSSATLEKAGVSQATDIARLSPGVQITQGGNSLQIYIRGAGDFSTTSYSNSAVAQNYDGVFAARSQYVVGSFYDLERVEVLKGPQGTLYGRNATGGALNIIPVQPKLGVFEGYASAGFQNYNGFNAEGAINIPIGDRVALRASYQGVSRDGYISDGTDDDKHHSFRLQLKAEASDAVTLRFGVNYQHVGGRGPGKVVWDPTAPTAPGITNPQPITPKDRWTAIGDSLNGLIGQVTAPPGVYPIDTSKAYQDLDVWGVNAHIDWDLGPATLTIIPAYQRVVNDSVSYPTFFFSTVNAFNNAPSTSDAQTLEVRLGNANDKAKWVVGAYFFNEDQNSYNSVRMGRAVDTNFIADLNTRAYAAFGELTYSLADSFRLTGGLRYTDETKKVDGYRYVRPGALACPVGGNAPYGWCETLTGAGTNVSGTYSASRVNYKAGFEFDAAPDSMIYGSVVTGFKSGGQSNADIDPYKPEEVTAYTIGTKNRFFGRLLQINAELFYMDYKDRQENFSFLDRSGAQVSSLFNAGKAVAKGASLDVTLRPSQNDTLRFAAEYVKSEYKEFNYQSYGTARPASICNVSAIPNGTAQIGYWNINCNGFELPRTPKWSGMVSYNRIFDMANGGQIEFAPDMSFSSARWLNAEYLTNVRAKGYVAFNANLTYRAPDDQYSVQLFMKNIGNEAIYTGTATFPFINNYNGHDIAPPRTYGARFRVNF